MNIRKSLLTNQMIYQQSIRNVWKGYSSFSSSSSTTMDMEKLQNYLQLRIYQDKRLSELLNLYACNTLCQSDLFVDNADKLYHIAQKILGNTITNSLVKSTMGKAFTAGEVLHDLQHKLTTLNAKNVPVVIDYASEALPGDQDIPDITSKEVVDMFIETIKIAGINNKVGNTIAIKCSPIISPKLLRKMNKAQQNLISVFENGDVNKQNVVKASVLQEQFRNCLMLTFEDTDFAEYLSLVLKRDINSNDLDSIQISLTEWNLNAHCYYVQNDSINQNKLFNLLTSYTNKEAEDIKKFCDRLESVFQTATNYNNRVLVDAEQTYFQDAIDSITQQMQVIYNKESPIVYNTFQNYLKNTEQRVKFEIQRCKMLKIPFGIKIVRGAYMVEENRLAREFKYESPIFDSLEKTHKNYDQNMEFIINNLLPKSELLIASHNEQSVKLGEKILETKGIDKRHGGVSFAQLYGLADHLTYSLHRNGCKVYKYVPFGATEIMIPYLIRRAQESKQMLGSTQLQKKLISTEILTKLKGN